MSTSIIPLLRFVFRSQNGATVTDRFISLDFRLAGVRVASFTRARTCRHHPRLYHLLCCVFARSARTYPLHGRSQDTRRSRIGAARSRAVFRRFGLAERDRPRRQNGNAQLPRAKFRGSNGTYENAGRLFAALFRIERSTSPPSPPFSFASFSFSSSSVFL